MATNTVSNDRVSRLSEDDAELVDKIGSLLEGIEGFALSHEDGGYYSGSMPNMSTVRRLGGIAVDLLRDLKFGKEVRHG